ncbi:hypothetical protein G6F36_015604 [Rhizopus arrhizus]|nr:hypothetical protein G6F36_015604 [Rhizopus arrhizus]
MSCERSTNITAASQHSFALKSTPPPLDNRLLYSLVFHFPLVYHSIPADLQLYLVVVVVVVAAAAAAAEEILIIELSID